MTIWRVGGRGIFFLFFSQKWKKLGSEGSKCSWAYFAPGGGENVLIFTTLLSAGKVWKNEVPASEP